MPGVLEKNKITAQNLIDLKNAINQIGSYNLLKKETSVVKDTTVKYYCDLTGVLSAYDVINVIFPNETENLSSYPQISIDNKNTYYEIKKGNSLVALRDLQGKANVLYFDGTNWQVVSNDSTGDSLPIGTTLLWYADNIPTGYVELNGQELSRATYSELFDVIGTTFGSGDGSTTFNVPDMRDKVPVGVSSTDTNINAIGKTYGEKKHTMTQDEVAPHSHGFQGGAALFNQKDQGVKGLAGGNLWVDGIGTISTTSTDGGNATPFNVMQPSLALRFICKAFNVTNVVNDVLNIFPVGSLFFSTTPTNPSAWLGGTWEIFGNGRVLVGVDSSDNLLNASEKTGGSINPLSEHSHLYRLRATTLNGNAGNQSIAGYNANIMSSNTMVIYDEGNGNSAGDNSNHNNWQPYITCYMWKRTA